MKQCKFCGEDFEPKSGKAVFCSTNCRVKWNNNPENKKAEIEVEEPKLLHLQKETMLEVGKNGLKERPTQKRVDATKEFRDGINKTFGDGSLMLMSEKSNDGYDVVPTGSIGIDEALGIGGLPRGRIVEIYGPEGSGKTTITTHVMAIAQKMGLKCLFVDAESSFDPDYATAIGVKIEELDICQPSYGEEALEVADRAICTGKYGVVVIDSVAALVPKGELEGQMGDSKMGLHAKLMAQACRKMVGSVSKSNTLLIFINQLRMNIGGYGNPEVVTGGKSLGYAASVRIDIRRIAQIKDGEEIVGNRTKAKIVKNKCAPPYRTAEFDINFGEGISKWGEIVDLGVTHGIIKKSGSWFSYGEMKLGQGREALKTLLADNPDVAVEIEGKVREKLKEG